MAVTRNWGVGEGWGRGVGQVAQASHGKFRRTAAQHGDEDPLCHTLEMC